MTEVQKPPRLADHIWSAGRGVVKAAHRLPSTTPLLAEVRDLVLETPEAALKARLYRPDGAEQVRPGLVFFHGGGFVLCDLDTHDELCRWLAAKSGAVVISVDYRLAPQHRFPAQLTDACESTRWVIGHAGELGIDPERMALGGDSAGGYLAAATAARLNEDEPGTIALQLLIYPIFHIDETICEAEALAAFRFAGRTVTRFLQRQLLDAGSSAPAPGGEDVAHAPPTLLVSGGLDPIRTESDGYAAALKSAGRPVAELRFPKMMHGVLSFPSMSKANLAIVQQVGEALGLALDEAAA